MPTLPPMPMATIGVGTFTELASSVPAGWPWASKTCTVGRRIFSTTPPASAVAGNMIASVRAMRAKLALNMSRRLLRAVVGRNWRLFGWDGLGGLPTAWGNQPVLLELQMLTEKSKRRHGSLHPSQVLDRAEDVGGQRLAGGVEEEAQHHGGDAYPVDRRGVGENDSEPGEEQHDADRGGVDAAIERAVDPGAQLFFLPRLDGVVQEAV